jgi:hypothetical protein
LHFRSVKRGIAACNESERVVHVEFDGMRRHLEPLNLGHFQLDVTVDEIVVEHPAVLEEGAILVEVLQCFAERTANRRDRLQLFLRQILEILVHCRARIELVLNAVETGHQHRGESEIRISHRIGETHLNPLGLRI